MLRQPINIFPGAYTKPDGREVTGLCVVLDNLDGQWEVTTSDNYTTVIKIKNGSKWNVDEYTDPETGERKMRLFREGAKLNGVAQEFNKPTEEAYTQGASAAKSEGPELKIYYTTPEDSNTPPIKIASR
jgi:hypothetical protein